VRRLTILTGVLVAIAAAVGAWAAVGYLGREAQFRQLIDDGERAMQAGDVNAAVEAFSGAIALRPASMVAFYRRGEAHAAQRRREEARRDFTEASRLAADAPQPLVALGKLHDQAGDYLTAVGYYERAADQLRSEDPALLYSLALARYRGGASVNAPASAEKPLLEAIVRRESFPEAHYLLGLVRRDMQNLEGAVGALEAAVRLAPEMSAAREELADVYRQLGRPVDEMRQLQELAKQDGRAARRVSIALAEARTGQYGYALGTLSAALAKDPQNSQLQLALGRVHLERAERSVDPVALRQARDALEKALGGTARRSEGLSLYGRALDLAGDTAAAVRILDEAVATTPVDPEAFAFLADAAERLGRHAAARDALINLDALQGDMATAEVRAARARRVGALSLAANDARTALPYLIEAYGRGHTDAGTLGLLARARWLTGDTAGARDALTKALALDPTDPELQRLARAIR
jgi:tetratricopeptide (TPR) repeat protein